jgi:DNA topoisomerase-1
MISANIGMFGPYVVHQKDFRSLKPGSGDDVYTITLERALEIFKEPKKFGQRGRKAKSS